MATHVYANGHEIACKATDGTAPAAFPDPCWSPPPPPAGPVVIPYANFTTASKIRNGTRSVFIKGQTVALENKSYFVNSTGNEPATYAFGKGLMTGALKGKAYFQSWSMNVKFEGRGVARNFDLVTHNHGSYPSNTALFPYLSRQQVKDGTCSKEREEIKTRCEPDKDENGNEKHWRESKDYCAGLTGKNGIEDPENFVETNKDRWGKHFSEPNNKGRLQPVLADLSNAPSRSTRAEQQFWAQAKGREFDFARENLNPENFKNLPKTNIKRRLAVTGQDALASLNDCLRARRCNLVPYESNKMIDDRGGKNNEGEPTPKVGPTNKIEHSRSGGCCPGQTGHHLIYGSMIEDRDKNGKVTETRCEGYDHATAPTVCVEGRNQYLGSHGRVHKAMDSEVTSIRKQKWQAEKEDAIKNGRVPSEEVTKTIRINEAIDAAVESHATAFASSECDSECIKAQLINHYSKICDGAELRAINRIGNFEDLESEQGAYNED